MFHFSPTGKFINRFGSKGDGADPFNWPESDIAVDAQSRVYVSDWQGVQVFDAAGRHLGRIAKRGTRAAQIALGPDGALYAALGWGQQVQRFTTLAPPVP